VALAVVLGGEQRDAAALTDEFGAAIAQVAPELDVRRGAVFVDVDAAAARATLCLGTGTFGGDAFAVQPAPIVGANAIDGNSTSPFDVLSVAVGATFDLSNNGSIVGVMGLEPRNGVTNTSATARDAILPRIRALGDRSLSCSLRICVAVAIGDVLLLGFNDSTLAQTGGVGERSLTIGEGATCGAKLHARGLQLGDPLSFVARVNASATLNVTMRVSSGTAQFGVNSRLGREQRATQFVNGSWSVNGTLIGDTANATVAFRDALRRSVTVVGGDLALTLDYATSGFDSGSRIVNRRVVEANDSSPLSYSIDPRAVKADVFARDVARPSGRSQLRQCVATDVDIGVVRRFVESIDSAAAILDDVGKNPFLGVGLPSTDGPLSKQLLAAFGLKSPRGMIDWAPQSTKQLLLLITKSDPKAVVSLNELFDALKDAGRAQFGNKVAPLGFVAPSSSSKRKNADEPNAIDFVAGALPLELSAAFCNDELRVDIAIGAAAALLFRPTLGSLLKIDAFKYSDSITAALKLEVSFGTLKQQTPNKIIVDFNCFSLSLSLSSFSITAFTIVVPRADALPARLEFDNLRLSADVAATLDATASIGVLRGTLKNGKLALGVGLEFLRLQSANATNSWSGRVTRSTFDVSLPLSLGLTVGEALTVPVPIRITDDNMFDTVSPTVSVPSLPDLRQLLGFDDLTPKAVHGLFRDLQVPIDFVERTVCCFLLLFPKPEIKAALRVTVDEALTVRVPFVDSSLRELLSFADEFDRKVVQGLLVRPSPIERQSPFLELQGVPIENGTLVASVWPKTWRVVVIAYVVNLSLRYCIVWIARG
jgi:hypothetical protein